MQLSQLIQRFRIKANDKAEPYFNEDKDVTVRLNEAVFGEVNNLGLSSSEG